MSSDGKSLEEYQRRNDRAKEQGWKSYGAQRHHAEKYALPPVDSIARVDVAITEDFGLWLMGDQQLGHISFDGDKFARHCDRARQESWRTICVGDAVENVSSIASVARFGALDEQRTIPGESSLNTQMQAFTEMVHGIRFDAYATGNHEARALRAGFDPAKQIADMLSATYLADGGWVVYKGSKYELRIFVHHGEGPIVSPTTLFDRLQRDYAGADIYVAGHTHHLLVSPVLVNDLGTERTVWRVRSGSYLQRPRYGVRRPVIPSSETGSVLFRVTREGAIAGVEILI